MNSRRLLGTIVSLLMVFVAGCHRDSEQMMEKQPSSITVSIEEFDGSGSQSEPGSLEANWGIQVESVMLSAGGYMVDFRFRVLDTDRAAPIFNRKIMPHMIDQATGATFIVPAPAKVGPLRSGTNIKAGKTYFVLFANPSKYVKSGDKITIVIGDFKVQDLIVDDITQSRRDE